VPLGNKAFHGFKNQVDAFSSKVSGFVPDKNLPLSSYQFRLASFL